MIDIIIKDFPFPPSVNTHLVPAINKVGVNNKGKFIGKGHFFKSKEHKIYAKQVKEWSSFYIRHTNKLAEEIKNELEILKNRFSLEAEIILVTNKEKILKFDADNRIKSVLDNLCKLLNIDDRYIFKVSAQKVISNSSKQYAIIKLKSKNIENENEIKIRFGIKS